MYQKSVLNSRKILFVLCLIFTLNIAGCTNEKADIVSGTSSFSDDLGTKVNAETELVANGVAIETNAEKRIIENKNILKVLKNKKKYFNTEFKEYRYLKDYSSSNYMNNNGEGKYVYNEDSGSADFKIDYWCEVDMDSDGNKEVILQTDYGNVLILHSEDNIVYCYAFPFRGMKNIKTDGSFESSGSAANTYIGKLRFVDGECYYEEICADDELEKDNPIYRINKKHTSREEVKSFIKQQEKKEDDLVEKGYPISD